MMLTMTVVKNARAADRNYKLSDSRGLYLFVTAAGGKSWRFKYRYGGKEKLLTIGRYPDVGLVTARSRVDDARKLLREGRDPAFEAQREKRARIDAEQATFRKCAETWLEDQEPLWSRSHAVHVRRRIEQDLYPQFGNMPIGSIDSVMVLRALRKIEARGSIETAKRVRGYIFAIFKRARGERLVCATTLLEIDLVKEALKPVRHDARLPALLTLPQLLEFQKCIDCSTSCLITKLASRLLALTMVRPGALRTARWSEFQGIDWDDPDRPCEAPIWRVPAEHIKLEIRDKLNSAFDHEVPLSNQTVQTLRVLHILTGTGSLLFPSDRSWTKPMSDATLSAAYRRIAGGKYDGRMVPHGWRAAFSTIMNERAAELERDGDRMLIDMCLAHAPRGISPSERIYNRARYLRPRAVIYQAWADLVSQDLPDPLTLLVQRDR
jgi:integrase